MCPERCESRGGAWGWVARDVGVRCGCGEKITPWAARGKAGVWGWELFPFLALGTNHSIKIT